MLTPRPMQQVNIFIQEEDVEQVTIALARLETLNLTEPAESETWSDQPEGPWSELTETYNNQAQRIENLLQALQISREDDVPLLERLEPKQDATTIEETLQEAEELMQEWQDQREEVEHEIERLELLLESVRQLEPLEISVEQLRDLKHLYLLVGTIPKRHLENLQIVLFRIPFVFIPVHEFDERVLVFAATDQAHAPILDRALHSMFIEPVELPETLTGTPSEAILALEEQLAEAKNRRDELKERRRQLAEEWRLRLLPIWHQAQSNATVTKIINQLEQHEDVYLMTGWVPDEALEQVVMTVQDTSDGRADVKVLEPVIGGRHRVPTQLQNPGFLRPFESIVSTFGFPGYDELDPTPLVALTFVLMYGMMFGDVGHGLLLTLAGVWLWRRGGGMVTIGPVLVISALSATAFGFLYGSVFGREDILPHLWLSPLGSIANLLIFSIGAGIVLLNVGFLLHLFSAWRARDWGQLLFGQSGLAGIWLYWALLGGAIALWQGVSLSITLWLLLILIPAMLIFLHEPLSHLLTGDRPLLESDLGEYSVVSFFELFEAIISGLSNSLSFVRLGAFAVAHAGLSQIVFVLANLTGGGVGYWFIVALGTVLVVGFEGLIVGIQTLRLEYYEFFGKFFDGSGRVFVPLRLSKAEQS